MSFNEAALKAYDAWKLKIEELYTPGNGYKSECLTSLIGDAMKFSPKSTFFVIGALHADVPNKLILAKAFLMAVDGRCAIACIMKEPITDRIYIDLETMWVFESAEKCGFRDGLLHPSFKKQKSFYVEDAYLVSLYYNRPKIKPNESPSPAETVSFGDTKKLIDPYWAGILQHTVGAAQGTPKSNYGYRNYYCESVGTGTHQILLNMATEGLLKPGRLINNGADQYFYATKAGCEAIGLHKAAIERAINA